MHLFQREIKNGMTIFKLILMVLLHLVYLVKIDNFEPELYDWDVNPLQ